MDDKIKTSTWECVEEHIKSWDKAMDTYAQEKKPKNHKGKHGYNWIKIIVIENGYVAEIPGKTYAFKDLDELNVWMKDHMAPVGELNSLIKRL